MFLKVFKSQGERRTNMKLQSDDTSVYENRTETKKHPLSVLYHLITANCQLNSIIRKLLGANYLESQTSTGNAY